jgi:hypothetical protein
MMIQKGEDPHATIDADFEDFWVTNTWISAQIPLILDSDQTSSVAAEYYSYDQATSVQFSF